MRYGTMGDCGIPVEGRNKQGDWSRAALFGRRALTAAATVAVFAGISLSTLPPSPARAAESAILLMYHRFGEDDYPSTSVSLEQFDAHLRELKEGGYNVLPVSEIVETLRGGGQLPDNTIGITIDDAYASVYEEGWPRLKAAGFPFTVFIATSPVDRGGSGYMSWDNIREMAAAGVEIGSQTVTHPHMADADAASNRRELEVSADRIEAELGVRPAYLAYPFGEASAEIEILTAGAGYAAAFGQHSSVLNASNDFYYLPRFPMNRNYGDIERFRRIVRSLPLPVEDLVPSDPMIGENPPAFGFTLPFRLGTLPNLACYHSKFQRLDNLERLGPRRIEIRFDKPFPPGRNRINCTAPGPDGRWRWFGMQYYVPVN